MPTVRIKGWPPAGAPSVLPPSLSALLEDEAEMDADQVAAAFKRLTKGREVDIPFDPGDEEMARAMMKKLAALGLDSELCDDAGAQSFWRTAHPRLWLYATALIVGFIFRAPWVSVLLLAIVVGGFGCALILRRVTRRTEQRLEILDKLDPNDQA
ncbi:MAG TPA: hypothetical protein VFC25_12015 [Verrucomicrobiae bacterium]|nr:hypothetical protein [Verrucomicrobiae bacterium]